MRITLTARILEHVASHGPQNADALAGALGCTVLQARNALGGLADRKALLPLLPGRPQPQWYGLPDDPRTATRREELLAQRRAAHVAPTTREVQAQVRERAALVLPHVTRSGVTERDLTAALPDLAISHLRAALTWLLDDGQIVRSEKGNTNTRCVYHLNVLDLPEPRPVPNRGDQRVERHLTQVSLAGAHDTAINMASVLRLPRYEVERGLSALQAQGRLRCKWVGSLPVFRVADLSA